MPGGGQEDGVQQLGERALARAVVPEHGDKAPGGNLKVYAAERLLRVPRVCEMQVLYPDYGLIGQGFHLSTVSQRQAAPQGRQRPVEVTGNPSSRLSDRPPKRV